MIKTDTHVHTLFSFDGRKKARTMCEKAIEAGVDVIAFTDHCDVFDGKCGHKEYFAVEEECEKVMTQLKEEYAGRLKVLYGLELGQPHHQPEVARHVLSHPYDMILGSVHILPDGRDIYFIEYKNTKDADAMFDIYFDELARLIEFGGFDSLAHLDYPLRVLERIFEKPTVEKYKEKVLKVLELAAKSGIALEINTRGLSDWQQRIGPEDWVLAEFKRLGGKYITVGSDSHIDGTIGDGFAESADAVKRIGFNAITYYENRKPIEIAVD